jgi:hypothetical protein
MNVQKIRICFLFYKVFQNYCGIVVGFDNLSVLNFDAY